MSRPQPRSGSCPRLDRLHWFTTRDGSPRRVPARFTQHWATVTAEPKEADITDSPAGDRDNSIDLITTMGWEPLPYGCVGIARRREVGSDQVVWSWIILIPWAVNDSKPWVDGTTLFELTLKPNDQQKAEVLQEMRDILDNRYGESVAKQSVEDFLRDFEDGA